MTAKKATKKPAAKKPAKEYKLLLALDAEAQKQLEVAHKITGEKTATKAIIQCMHLADHYMKSFKEQEERANIAEQKVREQTHAINLFLGSLKQLDKVVSEEEKKKANKKARQKNWSQLTVELCENCNHAIDDDGMCPDCD